eukprot:UN27551
MGEEIEEPSAVVNVLPKNIKYVSEINKYVDKRFSIKLSILDPIRLSTYKNKQTGRDAQVFSTLGQDDMGGQIKISAWDGMAHRCQTLMKQGCTYIISHDPKSAKTAIAPNVFKKGRFAKVKWILNLNMKSEVKKFDNGHNLAF